jgi:hypothetical protein
LKRQSTSTRLHGAVSQEAAIFTANVVSEVITTDCSERYSEELCSELSVTISDSRIALILHNAPDAAGLNIITITIPVVGTKRGHWFMLKSLHQNAVVVKIVHLFTPEKGYSIKL